MNIQKDLEILYNKIWNEPDDKKELINLLPKFYEERLETLKTSTRKDIMASLFRIRNTKFQELNCEILKTNVLKFIENRNIFFAWQIVLDSIDFAREPAKTFLINFLESWLINDHIFINILENDKWKYRFYACEYIYTSYNNEKIQFINNYLIDIIRNPNNYNYFVKTNALDALYRSPQIPNNLIELRNIVANINNFNINNQNIPRNLKINKNIYSDSQNVHITEINEAIKQSILNLSKDEEVRGNTIDIIIEKILKYGLNNNNSKIIIDKVIDALNRIKEDPAIFEIQNTKKFKLSGVLTLVWNRIEKEDISDLYLRLLEELTEASGQCSTGHLSRIVSSLCGYFSDIKQMENYKSQLKQCIQARINAMIKKDENMDDIMTSLITDKILYNNFKNKYKNIFYQELKIEFKDIIDNFDNEFDLIYKNL